MSATKHKSLAAAVRAAGGTIEECPDGRYVTWQLDSPPGMVWSCAFVHALVVQWDDAQGRREAHADAMERVAYGVQPCTDPLCDYCHPTTDQED